MINSDFYLVNKSAWEKVNKRKNVYFEHFGLERLRWNEGASRKGKTICCHYCGQKKKVILDLNIYKSHVSNTYTKAESHHT